jgi:Flp pilus assembly pilin Flp
MLNLLRKLLAEEAAQDLAEYGIALAVIGVIAAAAAIVIAKDVGTLWSQAQNVISSATNAATS